MWNLVLFLFGVKYIAIVTLAFDLVFKDKMAMPSTGKIIFSKLITKNKKLNKTISFTVILNHLAC